MGRRAEVDRLEYLEKWRKRLLRKGDEERAEEIEDEIDTLRSALERGDGSAVRLLAIGELNDALENE